MTEIEEVTAKAQKRLQAIKDKGGYVDALHIPNDQLVVTYNGKERYILSKRLIDQQNCWSNLEEIKEAHWLKLMIYEMIEEETDPKMLKSLAQDLTEIEYYLQELWKFDRDSNFHMFWEYPKCQCPSMDNRDMYPYRQVINLGCPLHGE